MKTPPEYPRSGRFFLIFIGLATAMLGATFVWLLASSYLRARTMRTWPEVPCTILVSSLEERQHDAYSKIEYRHRILYGYEYGGRALTSENTSSRGNRWSSHRDDIIGEIARYPVGERRICHVCPIPPYSAVMKPDSLAPGYTLWFPFLFVVGGLGIVIKALKPHSSETETAS